MSNFYDDNHYTTGTCLLLLLFINFVALKVVRLLSSKAVTNSLLLLKYGLFFTKRRNKPDFSGYIKIPIIHIVGILSLFNHICISQIISEFFRSLYKKKWRCPWCNGYRRRKMETATRVQILDETDCISHSTNTLGKGMNPIILPPAMGK